MWSGLRVMGGEIIDHMLWTEEFSQKKMGYKSRFGGESEGGRERGVCAWGRFETRGRLF